MCVCDLQPYCKSAEDDDADYHPVGDDGVMSTLQAEEVDEPSHPQSPPRLIGCEEDALASAENENNMNVESENNSGTGDRAVLPADAADVWAAVSENLEGVTNSGQDVVAFRDAERDETQHLSVVGESSSVGADFGKTESTVDHAIVSSISDVVIEVPDVSDLDDFEVSSKTANSVGKETLASDKPTRFQQSDITPVDEQPATVNTRPTTRVIRLNRNFSRSPAECPVVIPTYTGAQKSVAKRRSDDDSALRSKPAAVAGVSAKVASRPKLSSLDRGRRLSGDSQSLAMPKTEATGRVLPTYAKSSQNSASTVGSKSASEEHRKIRRSLQGVDCRQSDVAGPADEQRAGSSESDSLTKTQLEILELEMRARAIKAMIRAQEEMEELEASAAKKRRSSDSEKRASASTATPRRRGDLRSLQSVVGRSIVKRAEFVARRRPGHDRVQQRRSLYPGAADAQRNRLPQPHLVPYTPRTVSLSVDTRVRPTPRYDVTSPRFASTHFRQRPRRVEMRRNLASSASVRGDKRRIFLSRSVRLVPSQP